MYFLNKIIRKLTPTLLPRLTNYECQLIDRLRAKICALPELNSGAAHSPAEKLWLANRGELRLRLMNDDPRLFLSFRVIGETMFVDSPPYICQELAYLRESHDWETRWKPALRESKTIPAPTCHYYSASSGNLIHHAYHLRRFESMIHCDIANVDTILEFGGGYGGMCRLFYQLGFQGRYFIFDLPEFSALQEFYLASIGIPVQEEGVDSKPGVVCFSEFAQFEILNREHPVDLFIGTWSLSETPLLFRQQVLSVLTARNILIGYQHEFQGIDNNSFFKAWCSVNSKWNWLTSSQTYFTGDHTYIVGNSINA